MMEKDLKSLIIIFKAYNSLEKSVKHSLIGTEININEFTAMEALYVKGPLTTQSLIDTILIPNSSMTYVLDLLNKKGYIERKNKAEDNRVKIISLTEKGTAIFEEIYKRHFQYIRTIIDVISPDEEVLLQDLLKKIGKKAEEVLN